MFEGPADQKVTVIGMPTGTVSVSINGVPCEIHVNEEDFKKLVDAGMWTTKKV